MLRSSFFFGATALLLLAGCGDDDGDTMAGTPDLGPPPEEDMGPPPPAEELFDECVIDEQCHAALGPTAFCRTAAEGWPEGFCTLPCADRTPCDDGAIFHHCIDAFGPERCIFASNWPVDKLFSTYDVLIDAYTEIVAGFSPDEKTAMLSGNAKELYRL